MRSVKTTLLSSLLLAVGRVAADISFNSTRSDSDFNGVIASGIISDACAAAYAASVKCSKLLFTLRDSNNGPDYFNSESLGELCTRDCIDSLNAWDRKLNEDCTDSDKQIIEDPTGSAVYLSLALREQHAIQENLYWTFCLADSNDHIHCLTKKDLPTWPSASQTSDSTIVSAFCNDNCRVQESNLISTIASNTGVTPNVTSAEQLCTDLDFSTFPMNQNLLEAFGTDALASNDTQIGGSNGAQSSGQIQGTDYNLDFYTTGYATSEASSQFRVGLAWVSAGLVVAGTLLL